MKQVGRSGKFNKHYIYNKILEKKNAKNQAGNSPSGKNKSSRGENPTGSWRMDLLKIEDCPV